MQHAKDFASGFQHITPDRIGAGAVFTGLVLLVFRLVRRRPPNVNLTVLNPGRSGGGFGRLKVAAVIVGVLACFAAYGKSHHKATAKAAPAPSPSPVPSHPVPAAAVHNVTTYITQHASGVPSGPWLAVIAVACVAGGCVVVYTVVRYVL
jgi:hypothetical protein